jgi:hypothetical protein
MSKFSRFTDAEASVVMGRPFKSGTRELPRAYMGTENGNHIFLSMVYDRFFPGGKLQLEKVDNRMVMVRKQEVKPKVDGRTVNYLEAIQTPGGIFFLGTTINTGDKITNLYAFPINSDKMALGEPQLLEAVDYSKGSRKDSKEFKFSFAPDSSKILLYYNVPGKKDEFESFGFKVFDTALEQLYDLEVEIPYTQKLFDVLQVAIDNDGTIYLAGKHYNEKRRESRKGAVNYSTKILVFKDKSAVPTEIDVIFDDVFISSLKMNFRDKYISIVGFFSDYKSVGEKGVFVMDIDKEKAEIIKHNLKFFDKKFFGMGLTAKEKERINKRMQKGKDVAFYEFTIDHVLPGKDGSFTIVAEQRYIQVVTTSTGPNGATRTDTYYNNNHLLVFKVNKDNEIDWYSKVVKLQRTSNDGGFSNGYVMIPTENKLFFLFNEGKKAYDPKKTKKPGFVSVYVKSKKSMVSLASVDAEGNTSKVKVMDGKVDKFILIPRGTAVQNGTIVTHFFNSKQRRYGSLTVNGMINY